MAADGFLKARYFLGFKLVCLKQKCYISKMKETFFITAINKMLEISGSKLTYYDVLSDKDWFTRNTMSPKQSTKLKVWFIYYHMKHFKSTKKYAESSFNWFDLSYGLKIKE